MGAFLSGAGFDISKPLYQIQLSMLCMALVTRDALLKPSSSDGTRADLGRNVKLHYMEPMVVLRHTQNVLIASRSSMASCQTFA